MFSIYDGRESFYQWDLDRKIIVEDSSIKEVHFCNKTEECSLVVETYTEDGVTLANVPNILLTTDWKIRVYGYTGDFTKYEECFRVNKRSKPADYIYTETELKSYEDLEQRIEALESGSGGTTGGGITQEQLESTLENYVTKEYLQSNLPAMVDSEIENKKEDIANYVIGSLPIYDGGLR